ncbi:prolipoprotein diacylglyceryl transferase [Candidatus Woesearchaeota archaeon]|nr:prolipoprotein diacylglyceryl transferase [Candidatus Woesearchaeota archaeon]
MFVHNINPVIAQIGPIQIRYYSLVYLFGFLFTVFLLDKLAKSKSIKNLTRENASDLITFTMLGVIIGGRIGHILLDIKYYVHYPIETVMIWHGGMSFIGGFLAGLGIAFFYCKRKKIDFYKAADKVIIYVPLFLALGRIANFVNGELYGYITDLPWAVKFPDVPGFRHPSQLYEACLKFMAFFILLFVRNKKHKPGFILALFTLLYGITRFIAEFFRYYSSLPLGLSTMQYISLIMVAAGTYFVIKLKR